MVYTFVLRSQTSPDFLVVHIRLLAACSERWDRWQLPLTPLGKEEEIKKNPGFLFRSWRSLPQTLRVQAGFAPVNCLVDPH